MKWTFAPDIHTRISHLVNSLDLRYIDPEKIITFRSRGSVSRARARIWSLPTIWQQALNIGPHYCIEVISEKFDTLSSDDQERVLIHELLHIPKTFSGSLVPHRHHASGRKTYRHYHEHVESLFKKLIVKSFQIKSH
jgi:predicted metallopeptidase